MYVYGISLGILKDVLHFSIFTTPNRSPENRPRKLQTRHLPTSQENTKPDDAEDGHKRSWEATTSGTHMESSWN